MYANKSFNRKHTVFFTWLMLALMMLFACATNPPPTILGHEVEFPPEKQVVVNCSAACSERGQCGTAVDGRRVVLAGQSGPVVENHDRLFVEGTAVTILASSVQTIEQIADGSQTGLRFYQIQPPEGQQAGWVAGWCVAEP